MVYSGERKLTYGFLALPYHTKIKIAQELNLLWEGDMDETVSDIELFKLFFRKAKASGLLGELRKNVEEQGA